MLLHSQPRALILPFIGAILVSTISLSWVAMYDAYVFGEHLKTADRQRLALVIAVVSILATWVLIYKTMYPRKWVKTVAFDFEKRTLTINPGKENRVAPFEEIRQIRFKAATSLFNTGYLFFIRLTGKGEEPLVVLTNNDQANEVFFTLQKAGLNVTQTYE
ncbi:MAG: hypothetical protein JNJ57_05940 [Saprospiraceae bacterium]|nr:hypothetical protein [Saprospiraceae bacterium]